MRKIFLPAILLIALCCASSYDSLAMNNDKTDKQHKSQAKKVLSSLTLRQKIAQLYVIEADEKTMRNDDNWQLNAVRDEQLGGVIVMDNPLSPTPAQLNKLQSVSNIPLLFSIDGEWGASMRYPQFPFFPRQMQLGALPDVAQLEEMGRLIGEECRKLNILINFAPDIDVNNNPNNPVIHMRSFGEDRDKVSEYAAAYMRGMQQAGIYTCAKHFPGHGDTDVDSHYGLPVLRFNRQRLDSLELYPFKKLIEQGVDFVMVGHLCVPALDPSGTTSSISTDIITGLLRNELGFDGIIVTDALCMKGVAEGNDQSRVPYLAYKAGVDMILMPNPEDVSSSIDVIENAVKTGDISEKDLDARVMKILMLKARAGMLEKDYDKYIDPDILEKLDCTAEEALIDTIAMRSVTLVSNTFRTVPLDVKSGRTAYIAYKSSPASKVMADALCERADVDCFFLQDSIPSSILKSLLESLAGYDNVILGIHGTTQNVSKGFGIDWEQMAAVGEFVSPVVTLVWFGSPYGLYRMPWISRCGAVMVAYADNAPNARAAAKVLCGEIPAVGNLPVAAPSFGDNSGEDAKGVTSPVAMSSRSSAGPDDPSGFVLLTDIIPDAIQEIRYHSTYNFVGDRVDGYEVPVALITREAAYALKKAADELLSKGYRIKIFDTYRPQMAVSHFVRWASDINDIKTKRAFYPEVDKTVLFKKGFIAHRSGHSRGSTVDLTLVDAVTGVEVDMGGVFDFFGDCSHYAYTGLTKEQKAARLALRQAMVNAGFKALSTEWWHFTLKNEPYPNTYFTFTISTETIDKIKKTF